MRPLPSLRRAEAPNLPPAAPAGPLGAPTTFHLGVPWWELVVRSAAIYLAILFAFRVAGKRELGQFTIYDLVLVLLVANAVQPAMTGPDSSLLGGLIIIATLMAINFAVAQLDRVDRFHRLFMSDPTEIIRDGKFLEAEMKRQGIDQEEVEMAIREHGLKEVTDVDLGVLEADGSISIIGKDTQTRTKRRVRRRYRVRH